MMLTALRLLQYPYFTFSFILFTTDCQLFLYGTAHPTLRENSSLGVSDLVILASGPRYYSSIVVFLFPTQTLVFYHYHYHYHLVFMFISLSLV